MRRSTSRTQESIAQCGALLAYATWIPALFLVVRDLIRIFT